MPPHAQAHWNSPNGWGPRLHLLPNQPLDSWRGWPLRSPPTWMRRGGRADASLSMVRYLPTLVGPVATLKPVVPKRRRHGSNPVLTPDGDLAVTLYLAGRGDFPLSHQPICASLTWASRGSDDMGLFTNTLSIIMLSALPISSEGYSCWGWIQGGLIQGVFWTFSVERKVKIWLFLFGVNSQ